MTFFFFFFNINMHVFALHYFCSSLLCLIFSFCIFISSVLCYSWLAILPVVKVSPPFFLFIVPWAVWYFADFNKTQIWLFSFFIVLLFICYLLISSFISFYLTLMSASHKIQGKGINLLCLQWLYSFIFQLSHNDALLRVWIPCPRKHHR